MPRARRSAAWVASIAIVLFACTRDYESLFQDPNGAPDAGEASADTDGSEADGGKPVSDAGSDVCTACNGGSSCAMVCAPGCPCSPRDCSDPTCSFVCHPGAPCVVTSSASPSTSMTVTCKEGSTCTVTCEEPPCSVVCEANAQCKLTCLNTGGSDTCAIDCVGGTTDESCSNSGGALRRACRSACP